MPIMDEVRKRLNTISAWIPLPHTQFILHPGPHPKRFLPYRIPRAFEAKTKNLGREFR